MDINNSKDALGALEASWNTIKDETRQILGSELHYQAMIYYCLRKIGIPSSQLGMNVKQRIQNPVSELFQELDKKKHKNFQGGFEPIPDIVIFKPGVKGDWRRRSRDNTLKEMLVPIEVKASEREKGRLRPKEIIFDIQKLAAQREEVQNLGFNIYPIMMIIDVTDVQSERMTESAIDASKKAARKYNVGLYYVSQETDFFHKGNNRG